MINLDCDVCDIRIRVQSLQDDRYCGEACRVLGQRRTHATANGARPGHDDYAPANPTQRALHKKAQRRGAR